MQAGQLITVRTNPATQFVDAIAQNAMAELTMVCPSGAERQGPGFLDGGLAAGGTVKSRLRAIVIESVQAIDYEIWLWGDDTFADANPENTKLWGFVALAASTAKQIGGAGLYYYTLTGLDIPYSDLMKLGQLYLGLIPRTAGGKAAGALGSVALQLYFEPSLGW